MKKADLVKLLAAEHNVTIIFVNQMLNTTVQAVQKVIAEGGRIALPGLGAFTSVPRAARKMKTPGGAEVTIEARRVQHAEVVTDLVPDHEEARRLLDVRAGPADIRESGPAAARHVVGEDVDAARIAREVVAARRGRVRANASARGRRCTPDTAPVSAPAPG